MIIILFVINFLVILSFLSVAVKIISFIDNNNKQKQYQALYMCRMIRYTLDYGLSRTESRFAVRKELSYGFFFFLLHVLFYFCLFVFLIGSTYR